MFYSNLAICLQHKMIVLLLAFAVQCYHNQQRDDLSWTQLNSCSYYSSTITSGRIWSHYPLGLLLMHNTENERVSFWYSASYCSCFHFCTVSMQVFYWVMQSWCFNTTHCSGRTIHYKPLQSDDDIIWWNTLCVCVCIFSMGEWHCGW